MRTLKDSGIEWLGKIPSEWEVRKVKNYYDIQTGFTPDTKNELYYDDNGYDWINISDIKDGKTIFETKKKVSKHYIDLFKPKVIPQGSLLYSFKLSVGQTAYAGKDIYSNEAIASFIPNEFVNLHYLRYSSMFIIKNAQTNIYNAKILNQDLIRNAYIPFPPLSQQQQIADFLDRKCAEIDTIIEKTKATIEEYKKLKQSVITEAVTKGIRGERPMKDSGIEWIGDIPSDWNLIQIKYLKSNDKNAFVDGPFGSNLKSIHFVEDGDVYVVESGFITTGKFVFKKFKTITASHFETIRRSECKGKDVIIAKIGANFGMAAELPELDKPSVVSGNSLKITLNQEKILNSIFVYELSVAKNRAGYVGLYNETAQPALSLSALNSFKLVVAPMEEQQEIANFLDSECAEIDKLIADKTQLLEEMESYKKAVIYEYVTGKKEVI